MFIPSYGTDQGMRQEADMSLSDNHDLSSQQFYQQRTGAIDESSLMLSGRIRVSQTPLQSQQVDLETSHSSSFVTQTFVNDGVSSSAMHSIITDTTMRMSEHDFISGKRLKLDDHENLKKVGKKELIRLGISRFYSSTSLARRRPDHPPSSEEIENDPKMFYSFLIEILQCFGCNYFDKQGTEKGRGGEITILQKVNGVMSRIADNERQWQQDEQCDGYAYLRKAWRRNIKSFWPQICHKISNRHFLYNNSTIGEMAQSYSVPLTLPEQISVNPNSQIHADDSMVVNVDYQPNNTMDDVFLYSDSVSRPSKTGVGIGTESTELGMEFRGMSEMVETEEIPQDKGGDETPFINENDENALFLPVGKVKVYKKGNKEILPFPDDLRHYRYLPLIREALKCNGLEQYIRQTNAVKLLKIIGDFEISKPSFNSVKDGGLFSVADLQLILPSRITKGDLSNPEIPCIIVNDRRSKDTKYRNGRKSTDEKEIGMKYGADKLQKSEHIMLQGVSDQDLHVTAMAGDGDIRQDDDAQALKYLQSNEGEIFRKSDLPLFPSIFVISLHRTNFNNAFVLNNHPGQTYQCIVIHNQSSASRSDHAFEQQIKAILDSHIRTHIPDCRNASAYFIALGAISDMIRDDQLRKDIEEMMQLFHYYLNGPMAMNLLIHSSVDGSSDNNQATTVRRDEPMISLDAMNYSASISIIPRESSQEHNHTLINSEVQCSMSFDDVRDTWRPFLINVYTSATTCNRCFQRLFSQGGFTESGACRVTTLDGEIVTISGICNLFLMDKYVPALNVLFATDCSLSRPVISEMFSQIVQCTFLTIFFDRHTSIGPYDTFRMLCTNSPEGIVEGKPACELVSLDYPHLADNMFILTKDMAFTLAKKVFFFKKRISVVVAGGASNRICQSIAVFLCSNVLFRFQFGEKISIFPWTTIQSVLVEQDIKMAFVSVSINNIHVVDQGNLISMGLKAAEEESQKKDLKIEISIGSGTGRCEAITTELNDRIVKHYQSFCLTCKVVGKCDIKANDGNNSIDQRTTETDTKRKDDSMIFHL